ncbi:MAG: hypothetical protein ACLT1W_15855 [Alistipes onderdonkii]
MNLDRSNYEQGRITRNARRVERESFERFSRCAICAEIRSPIRCPCCLSNGSRPLRGFAQGGRRMALRRPAAVERRGGGTLFVGLFVVADRTVSQGRERLMSQRTGCPQRKCPWRSRSLSEEEPQQASPAV